MTPWWADGAGYEICLPWFTDGDGDGWDVWDATSGVELLKCARRSHR